MIDMKPTLMDALQKLVNGQVSGFSDLTGLVYQDGVTPPSKNEINAKYAELIAEYDAKEYARNRKEEYPPMEDQLDYIFHNGVDKWKEDIVQPVKDKYPKS